jgi:hypothetical protein
LLPLRRRRGIADELLTAAEKDYPGARSLKWRFRVQRSWMETAHVMRLPFCKVRTG